MMRIPLGLATLLGTLVLASRVDFGLASPSTVRSANGESDEAVNYQVMSANDLTNAVFTLGGWSNFLCSKKKLQQPVDVTLVFIGRELLSSDVSSNQNSDPSLVKSLKNLYTASIYSHWHSHIFLHQRRKGWKTCCFQG